MHYKLDLGIDHLLIDEAQDTSPEQWDIIKKFVEEFTAGAGARSDIKRTIFAVGDDKQSIFSFQGAEPRAFDETRNFFRGRHEDAKLEFRALPFNYSFRSAPVVLEAVDRVFEQPAAHRGLTVDPVATVHEAVRVASPGLVELWPLVEPDEKPDVEPWDQPFDTTSETSPRVKLAKQIAAAVKEWLRRGDLVGDGDKRHPLRAGDILILVRQRGPLFEAIIRALKTADIAVAGADRLQLTEHIAIMDLLALGGRTAASAGRSGSRRRAEEPAVRHHGGRIVRAHLPRRIAARRVARAPCRTLASDSMRSMRNRERLSPFAFYARLLGGGARKAFLARLGAEANDALDEFLNLALTTRAGRRHRCRASCIGSAPLDRGEARHGDRARRGPGDDRARRQGPGGCCGRAGRHHHRAGRPADSSSQAVRVAGAECRSRHAGTHRLDADQAGRRRRSFDGPRRP